MLNKLRDKTQELLNRNDENFKKYSIINDILKNERCFYEMDMESPEIANTMLKSMLGDDQDFFA